MRYDLAFLLCCCKSFLGSDGEDGDGDGNPKADHYALLAVDRDATHDEIKRAYKRQSLLMHPDKLAQRGLSVNAESQAKFTKMKEAYEVLSDPHKRDTYDAIGARGMKWIEEPLSVDPQELAHNFAKSSVLDRSKIFGIFVAVAIAVFVLPVLVCLHVDGVFGVDASWLATLTPLWLWDVLLIFYHSHVILMGPVQRPEHIPVEEWVDPLPMNKRIFTMIRFLLIVLFEVLVALKLDQILQVPWFLIFIPLYVWEATTLYKTLPLVRMRIVSVDDLEHSLGKPFSEFTPAEKELIRKRYSVVTSTSSPDFDAAQKLKTRATHDVLKSAFRIVFVAALLIQLDGRLEWSWWLIFAPIWFMSAVVCCANYQAFAEVQRMAMEKDPNLFAPNRRKANDENNEAEKSTYGAVGENGGATPSDAQASTLTEDEKEVLRATVTSNSSKLCNKCCSQGFLLIIVFLFVAKLQGAGFSSFWIISPFLFVAGIMLCCIGCAIFGVSEVSTDGINFEAGDFAYMNAEAGAAPGPGPAAAPIPTVYVPPPVEPTPAAFVPAPAATDSYPNIVSEPERGETKNEDVPVIVNTHVDATYDQAPDVQTADGKLPAGEIDELD